MPILYSVISRQSTVLAKFAECVGNFAEVTEQIINRIPNESHKLTYSHGQYRIHYISENRVIYMCITDDVSFIVLNLWDGHLIIESLLSLQEFDRTRAFLFLADIKQRFNATYGLQIATAISYAMNTEFSRVLQQQMQHFSSRETDSITRIHGQIDELKDIMVKNIGKSFRSYSMCLQ